MSPEIVPLVMADLEDRYKVGLGEYGVPLRVDTPKNFLTEAYLETLDKAIYLRAEMARHESCGCGCHG